MDSDGMSTSSRLQLKTITKNSPILVMHCSVFISMVPAITQIIILHLTTTNFVTIVCNLTCVFPVLVSCGEPSSDLREKIPGDHRWRPSGSAQGRPYRFYASKTFSSFSRIFHDITLCTHKLKMFGIIILWFPS